MTTFELEEGTHRIRMTLSGYSELIAVISVDSSGRVTCMSVTSGACGGSSTPRISVSGSNVIGHMKQSGGTPYTPVFEVPFEAESAYKIDSPIKQINDNSASNGKCIEIPITARWCDVPSVCPKMSYNVNVPITGPYKLMGSVIADSNGHNSVRVQLGLNSVVWHIPISQRWQWSNVTDTKSDTNLSPSGTPVIFYLMKGMNKLYIYQREVNIKFDQFLLTSDMTFMPSGGGSTGSYADWVTSKGGKSAIRGNLPALLEIIDGYLFQSGSYSITLTNLLTTCDYYLGFG